MYVFVGLCLIYLSYVTETVRIITVDPNGVEHPASRIAVEFNSHLRLGCTGDNDDYPLFWEHLTHRTYSKIKETPYIHVVHSSDKAIVWLELDKIRVTSSHKYRCRGSRSSEVVTVVVQGASIDKDSIVKIRKRKHIFGKFKIFVDDFDPHWPPHLACFFKISSDKMKYARVVWSGGMYGKARDRYAVKMVDSEEGFIYSKLEIVKPIFDEKYFGTYTCSLYVNEDVLEERQLKLKIRPVILTDLAVVRRHIGQSFETTCKILAVPKVNVTVRWARNYLQIGNEFGSRSPNVNFESVHHTNDRLRIDSLGYGDSGVYSCFIEYKGENSTGAIRLRVISLWTYLPQTLGIAFELLCAFLFIWPYR